MSEAFRVGFVNRWERRDPRTGLNYASFLVQWHIYEPPYRFSAQTSQVKPGLLEYPLVKEMDASGLLYSAHVRPGIRFSDGTELTAEHVAASLEKTPAFKVHASPLRPLCCAGAGPRTAWHRALHVCTESAAGVLPAGA